LERLRAAWRETETRAESTAQHETIGPVAHATYWYRVGQARIIESALARVDVLLASYASGKRGRDEIE
jgi:hypothetical protein